jgi:hypothetical protein
MSLKMLLQVLVVLDAMRGYGSGENPAVSLLKIC